jgi:protein SCO1/2
VTKIVLPIALLVLVASARALDGQAVPAPALDDVGFDQHLNEQLPLNLEFKDEAGRPVELGRYFQGKPVVLVLAYYRCPMLCTLVLNGITRGLSQVPYTIGREYQVVTVSIDPRETSELAAAKKESYVTLYNRPGAAEGWHFLTGEEKAIKSLTQAVGFRYVYDAKQDQYIHAAGIVVLTPTGKVSRYLYGIDFSPRDLRLALTEASERKIGSPTDQVLLYCFHYDPSVGKYTADVMAIIRAGAILTIVVVGALVAFLVRRNRRARARLAAEAAKPPAAPVSTPADQVPGDKS